MTFVCNARTFRRPAPGTTTKSNPSARSFSSLIPVTCNPFNQNPALRYTAVLNLNSNPITLYRIQYMLYCVCVCVNIYIYIFIHNFSRALHSSPYLIIIYTRPQLKQNLLVVYTYNDEWQTTCNPMEQTIVRVMCASPRISLEIFNKTFIIYTHVLFDLNSRRPNMKIYYGE